MNILDLLQIDGIQAEHVSKGEYHSPCPECGGVDRFSSWPDRQNSNGRYFAGRFCCRGCNWNGDGVNYLQKRKGLTFMQAVKKLELNAGPMPEKIIRVWTPAPQKEAPGALWQSKANAFVVHCSEQLQGNSVAMAWLKSERGLNPETVKASRLGWNSKDVYQSRESWGLPPGKKIWLPAGLIIPNYTGDAVTRIRIRRSESPPDESRYRNVSGSNMQPMTLWADQQAVCVVESELDCLLINQEAGELVGVVGLGSAQIKPDAELHNRLMNAKTVLCSLDADGPGAKAVSFWRRYPGFKRWMVVRGKDPTEQQKAGIAVDQWIKAGLI